MNQEEYSSDSDASDEDFRPDKEDADSGSDPESEDDEPLEDDQAETNKTGGSQRKRKAAKPGAGKSSKASKTALDQREAGKADNQGSGDSKEDKELDEEEEKRRTDALWADFLGGSSNSSTHETKSTTTSTTLKASEATKAAPVSKKPVVPAVRKPAESEKKLTVEKIFEFAGERVVVTEEEGGSQGNAPKGSSPAASTAPKAANAPPSRGGGLGSVLNQIGKKNQLSTLEKTKLDWNRFKRQEGIEEELQTHNKGKDGFLERRDFLERTDVRQFEIEKSFRQSKRSNR
ncbi:craniofacial development protein 1 isoform X2 [Anopheles aquasalis]|nr:craniofacial development protein 1 isoform X2 [Anopheles aquasalis]